MSLIELAEEAEIEGFLEKGTASYGILQQVIHHGDKSLTDKQRRVYDVHIVPALVRTSEILELREKAERYRNY